MSRAPRYLVLALVLAAACGGDDGPGNPVDGSVVDAADPVPDANASGPGLAGLLVDPAEQPVPNLEVLACQATTCFFGASGDDGRFDFAVDPPADIAVKTHPDLAMTPRWAAALVPVDIVDGALVDLGTVYIPDLPDGAVLGAATEDPQTLALGDGLELTLNRADLTPPIGEFLYDVAARLVPPEHVPTYAELSGEQVVAVYAMHPFAGKSSSPMAVRVPTTLSDGTSVMVRTISELDGNFSDPVPGQANGGYITTDPGTGITRFTYLVISQ